jgi:hypothetical protein
MGRCRRSQSHAATCAVRRVLLSSPSTALFILPPRARPTNATAHPDRCHANTAQHGRCLRGLGEGDWSALPGFRKKAPRKAARGLQAVTQELDPAPAISNPSFRRTIQSALRGRPSPTYPSDGFSGALHKKFSRFL